MDKIERTTEMFIASLKTITPGKFDEITALVKSIMEAIDKTAKNETTISTILAALWTVADVITIEPEAGATN